MNHGATGQYFFKLGFLSSNFQFADHSGPIWPSTSKRIDLRYQVIKADVSGEMFYASCGTNYPTGFRCYFFKPAVQFITTMMGHEPDS